MPFSNLELSIELLISSLSKISIKKTKKDFRDYKVSSIKAKKIINFQPKFLLSEGIKSVVDFTIKNKIKNLNSKKYINILNSDKF